MTQETIHSETLKDDLIQTYKDFSLGYKLLNNFKECYTFKIEEKTKKIEDFLHKYSKNSQ